MLEGATTTTVDADWSPNFLHVGTRWNADRGGYQLVIVTEATKSAGRVHGSSPRQPLVER